METIWEFLLRGLENGTPMNLVTITAQNGSAPRGTGSQMLVDPQGRIAGTVGGGAVEYQCEHMAKTLLREGCSGKHHFDLFPNGGEDIGMICGGAVDVWFQLIDPADPRWEALGEKLKELLSAKAGGWLVQHLDGSFPSLADSQGKTVAGSQVDLPKCPLSYEGQLAGAHILTQLPVRERAIIFGGGHCSRALAPILYSVGFRVTVMDDRSAYAQQERFPCAERVICGDYGALTDHLTLQESDYIVIMTHGHSHDLEVEQQVLRHTTAYVGVIGSAKKAAAANKRLRELGFDDETIAKIHTPIGTRIKATTPEEIAVSIAGEMICERANRKECV